MSREDSYRLVQKNAHSAWNQPSGNFKKNLENDPEVIANLSPEKLSDCFSTELHQANLKVVWDRLGI
jgi:adenylosuccinate lyase